MKRAIGILAGKAGKAWRALNCGTIARCGGISYFNFAIHTEVLYDEKTYKALLGFSEKFHDLTGKKIAVCVSTPACPLVSKEMESRGVGTDVFGKRVESLGRFSDIGYHGHFYGMTGGGICQISDENYNKEIVIEQIRKEIGWFKWIGIVPEIYVAGWWFLTSDIVLELERLGISVDSSVRKGKTNTFGKSYIDDRNIPGYGEPFILPPSGSIVEIQSLFGPVMAPFMIKYHLSQYVDRERAGDLFFIFPLHDWDVPRHYSNILSGIKMLKKSLTGAEWMNIADMRASAIRQMRGNADDK